MFWVVSFFSHGLFRTLRERAASPACVLPAAAECVCAARAVWAVQSAAETAQPREVSVRKAARPCVPAPGGLRESSLSPSQESGSGAATPGLHSCCQASLSIAHAHLWFFVFLFKFSIFLAAESSLTLGNPVLQLSSTNAYSSLVPSLAVILLWNFWLCSSRKSSVEPQLVSYNTVNSFFSKDE